MGEEQRESHYLAIFPSPEPRMRFGAFEVFLFGENSESAGELAG
jgi:hypothetical protein